MEKEICKHKLLKIIDIQRGGFWFLFMFIGQSNKDIHYVCEKCGKVFR